MSTPPTSPALNTLLIASHNAGKKIELEAWLNTLPIHLTDAAEHHLPSPEETGSSFAENAAIKAQAAFKATGIPSLADDSGLVIPALGDQPGIHSARWSNHGDFTPAFNRIQTLLEEKHLDHTASAYFVCMLCLVTANADPTYFEGRVYGTLTFPPRGNQGFGYDPIFIPDGYSQTFAEMPLDEKQTLSHRTRAMEQLLDFLKNRA